MMLRQKMNKLMGRGRENRNEVYKSKGKYVGIAYLDGSEQMGRNIQALHGGRMDRWMC